MRGVDLLLCGGVAVALACGSAPRPAPDASTAAEPPAAEPTAAKPSTLGRALGAAAVSGTPAAPADAPPAATHPAGLFIVTLADGAAPPTQVAGRVCEAGAWAAPRVVLLSCPSAEGEPTDPMEADRAFLNALRAAEGVRSADLNAFRHRLDPAPVPAGLAPEAAPDAAPSQP